MLHVACFGKQGNTGLTVKVYGPGIGLKVSDLRLRHRSGAYRDVVFYIYT